MATTGSAPTPTSSRSTYPVVVRHRRGRYGDNPDGQNYDAFLAEPSQWSDADGDGCGDNPAGRNPDLFIYDPTQCEDNDGDGWGDNLSGNNPDPYLFDFDNDGYNDSIDVLPKLFSLVTSTTTAPPTQRTPSRATCWSPPILTAT